MQIKMRQNLVISKVPISWEKICHGIDRSRDIITKRNVIKNRWWRAWRRRRKAARPRVVAAPFYCQNTAAIMSYKLWVVFLRTSAAWESISLWAMDSANSKSLLVTHPFVSAYKDRCCRIHSGNCCLHRIGILDVFVGTKCTPPIPAAAASHAPLVAGSQSGISSAIQVGTNTKSDATNQKS